MKLERGDVLVQHDQSWWSKAAALLAGHPFPHAAIVHDPDKVVIWQSIHNGVGPYTLHIDDIAQRFEVWRPNCDITIKNQAVDWVITKDPKGYGYINLVIIYVMFKLGLKNRPSFLKGTQGYVCSQLIAEAYSQYGYDLVGELADEDTKPWDLRNPKTLTRILP